MSSKLNKAQDSVIIMRFHWITNMNYDNPALLPDTIRQSWTTVPTSLATASNPSMRNLPHIRTRQSVKYPSHKCNLVENVVHLSLTQSQNSMPIRRPAIESSKRIMKQRDSIRVNTWVQEDSLQLKTLFRVSGEVRWWYVTRQGPFKRLLRRC